jgi:hypothetical protein
MELEMKDDETTINFTGQSKESVQEAVALVSFVLERILDWFVLFFVFLKNLLVDTVTVMYFCAKLITY